MRFNPAGKALAVILSLFVVCSSAMAMGHGKGRTKIDFKTGLGDAGASSRLFAKLDVATGVATLPETGSHSKNDNLAGWYITVAIGSATFTAQADDKGKVSTPFNAKLTANGGIMQIKASGLNLEQLFPLSTVDGEHDVTVVIRVTATNYDPNTTDPVPAVAPTELSNQSVTFHYTVKNGQAKGKNF